MPATTEIAHVFAASQFGGGYHAPPATFTREFNLLPSPAFISVKCALTRVGGGGTAAIGIMQAEVNGQTVRFGDESQWPSLHWSKSGKFTIACFASGTAMQGSCIINGWA